MKISILRVNFGGIDNRKKVVEQEYGDNEIVIRDIGDGEYPWREGSLSPRMKARMIKSNCLDFVESDSDIVIWLDSSFEIMRADFVKWMVEGLGGNDFLFFKHPNRGNVHDEAYFIEDLVRNKGDMYRRRYGGEPVVGQYEYYRGESSKWPDNFLIASGCFAVKNNDKARKALKRWSGELYRWSCQDQISLPYILWNGGRPVKYRLLEDNIKENEYIKISRHNYIDNNIAGSKYDNTTCGVVMLVRTTSDNIYKMTQNAIDSLHASSNGYKFNIVLIESNLTSKVHGIAVDRKHSDAEYVIDAVIKNGYITFNGRMYKAPNNNNTTGIAQIYIGNDDIVIDNNGSKRRFRVPGLAINKSDAKRVSELWKYSGCSVYEYNDNGTGEWNYNKALNQGIQKLRGNERWVCIINNDIIAHKGWFENAVEKRPWDVASVISPLAKKQKKYHGRVVSNYVNYGETFSGFCYIVDRTVLNYIYPFDESLHFYHTESKIIKDIKEHMLCHKLIGTSYVDHLHHLNTNDIIKDKDVILAMRKKSIEIYDKKYGEYKPIVKE